MLATNQNVVAAINHMSGAAAMLVRVAQAVSFQVVDEDAAASFGGDPGVGSAALRVHAGIGDAKGGLVIDFHIGGAGLGRPDAFVRATRPVVRVLGDQGAVAETRLIPHHTSSNVSRSKLGQGKRGQKTWR